jgi:predicted small secreted protein
MKKVMILVALVALLAFTGCQTFHGIGGDIESLGETMQGD